MNNGFSTGEEDSRSNSDQICCLVDDGDRCRRSAGNAAYSKRIQKTVAQRRLKLNIDPQCARSKQRRTKDSEEETNDTEMDNPEVDWFQLQVNTLRRYKRHYKVQTRPGLNKAQLAETIQKHFKALPIDEKEIITYFIYMVKNNGNKLDQKNGMNSDSV
ncbi:Histone deacetylase complex subunit SAP30 homolog [Eumeta japonica]|uniref:Histone deacetylase complex subunit SAP30 homolog n=1 Tax=Eumeta variegata TaxID=151549 RepID=A0A4C1ZSY5_EUMVA|nr:Histone deacetylase complex subunit SAP30 homolog [Eumeta japonica]